MESIISNKVAIKKDEKFAAIIGLNPSKGADHLNYGIKLMKKLKIKITIL